jgi:hypothetical protein
MAKVITFTTTFPKGHISQGQPTDFPKMILEGKKIHTIRATKRWKVGDMASLRIWTGKPYHSKQEIITEKQIVKVYDFKFTKSGFVWINGICYGSIYFVDDTWQITELAKNDGLTIGQFNSWFLKGQNFEGQIICWEDPKY